MVIIGSGLSGLTAAINLAKNNCNVILVSQMGSECTQSVMAAGGINASLNTKGENDSSEEHFKETIKSGMYLADSEAVWNMTENAEEVVRWLHSIGTAFNLDENYNIELRNFGGQKKKRTAFAMSNTGKQVMAALIEQTRRYELLGLIKRYPHHCFQEIILNEKMICIGCLIKDEYSDKIEVLYGKVVAASGGMNGLFGITTGSSLNTGVVTADLFFHGVKAANLEMIQYHPTTYRTQSRLFLISESARAEGGRLFIYRNNEKWYFLEEKYPQMKNLIARDELSLEIYNVCQEYNLEYVLLDMTQVCEEVFRSKLFGFVDSCIEFININPMTEYLPVYPAIHYFMGGIYVDSKHRTNIEGVYAIGECACQYHGANRLGGNSLLSTVYGGKIVAQAVLEDGNTEEVGTYSASYISQYIEKVQGIKEHPNYISINKLKKHKNEVMNQCMGIVRDEDRIEYAIGIIHDILKQTEQGYDPRADLYTQYMFYKEVILCLAMLYSARDRKESRGAHFRKDYPDSNDKHFRKTTVASYVNETIQIDFVDIN
ncbi:succinate dehydrogenase / fumarate reductase flavoprotein subunit [Anaeromicropila populeti]|uniref:Succinate dehydrogenase / fumarate reductase flavoprotein subunit n=1 Tax=Anaeromicropila populeti TaxID=37658 RepID=A0A1I6ID77_9FIRM|nr:succinate dehydrogenase / fumarate reductase flavoprotein subunit [Anaeromicropila populeti]